MRLLGFAILSLAGVSLAGCSPPPPPPPDGSSGLVGVCLLPAEPPDADGKAPERQPWAGVELRVIHTDHSSSDPTWGLEYKTRADAGGRYNLALNPGAYLVFPQDPTLLKNVGVSGVYVKVEPGQFTDLTIDYDQLRLSHPPKSRP